MRGLNIPDHPAVACALRTGYPEPEHEPEPVVCAHCGREMTGRENVYLYEGDPVCGDCCAEMIRRDLSVDVLAELVGIATMTAEDYPVTWF